MQVVLQGAVVPVRSALPENQVLITAIANGGGRSPPRPRAHGVGDGCLDGGGSRLADKNFVQRTAGPVNSQHPHKAEGTNVTEQPNL